MEHFNKTVFVDSVHSDLTEEDVNLMNEFGIDFSAPIDYQPSKLYDNQIEDFMNTLQLDASYIHAVANQDYLSPPMPVNSESLDQSLSSPVASPYFITMAESPSESILEVKQVNNLPTPEFGDISLIMPVNFVASGHTLSLPAAVQSPMPMAESLNKVASEEETLLKKRQECKPKSEGGKATTPSSQKRAARRPKVYEIACPFEDKEKERKRLNAINARKHRVLQKEALKSMEQQLADCTIEKNILFHQKKELENKVELLTQQLEVLQRQCRWQPVQVMTFFPEGQ